MRELEENSQRYALQQEDINTLGVNTVALSHLNEALLHQQKQMGILQPVQATAAGNERQAQTARGKGLQARVEALAQTSRQASENARMVAEVPQRHSDALLADRDRLASKAANAGVTDNTTNLDNSATNRKVVSNKLLDQSIYINLR